MRLLINSTLLLLIFLLASCASTNPYTPFKMAPAAPPAARSREALLINSVETMHEYNAALHQQISVLNQHIANLKEENRVLRKRTLEQANAWGVQEKELHECLVEDIEVRIRPRATKKINREVENDHTCSQ